MNTWLIIDVIVFSTLACWSFQTSRSRKCEQAWREQTFPEAECSLIKEGCRYDIILSDGRAFHQAEILGTAQGKEADFLFGYGNMLVLRLSDDRKAYVRQACIRCMVESKILGINKKFRAQPANTGGITAC
ncbi:hypothetical protein O3683_02705 [Neisseria flavescens]|uniref:hypothetical protein n=1 Tax=Neisseria TaxID=482 RepID=UPI0008A9E816|nr:hypothetical protein [Neisseria sp. HMSC064D07]OHQ05244.1 hypothetical protein HMPREF2608_09810 [Neisseria sp. HMSC064D07]